MCQNLYQKYEQSIKNLANRSASSLKMTKPVVWINHMKQMKNCSVGNKLIAWNWQNAPFYRLYDAKCSSFFFCKTKSTGKWKLKFHFLKPKFFKQQKDVFAKLTTLFKTKILMLRIEECTDAVVTYITGGISAPFTFFWIHWGGSRLRTGSFNPRQIKHWLTPKCRRSTPKLRRKLDAACITP